MAEIERSELLRMGEVAQLLNVSRSKAYEMAGRSEIPTVVVGHLDSGPAPPPARVDRGSHPRRRADASRVGRDEPADRVGYRRQALCREVMMTTLPTFTKPTGFAGLRKSHSRTTVSACAARSTTSASIRP